MCNRDWTLAAISSEDATLKNLVEQFSQYITAAMPSLETFFSDFTDLLKDYQCTLLLLTGSHHRLIS